MTNRDDRPLLERLQEYAASSILPLHMPGHKRKAPLPDAMPADGISPDRALPYAIDLTEIPGFDNLHEAQGILKQGMARAAGLYGSERAFYLVGGSTAGILAGIRAAVRPGERVLVARNCHRSVYHALELCRLRPYYLCPPIDPATGLCGSIPPETVERALDRCPSIRLVIVTSPTYEGVLSDIAALSQICHARGLPLLVDEAHGAHLGFGPFPLGGVAAGADVVIHSLHKTLPSLTQTGLLHVNGRRVDPDEVERQLAKFQSSSPSYPLMASIDVCIRWMEEKGHERARTHMQRLLAFDRSIAGLERLWSPGHTGRAGGGWPASPDPPFFGLDPGKIYFCCRNAAWEGRPLTGEGLARLLREEYRIETEMAQPGGLLAMTSLCDGEDALPRLSDAVRDIDRRCEDRAEKGTAAALPPPVVVRSIEEAMTAPRRSIPLAGSAGCTAAEYVWAYPPGVPLLVPGERITQEFVQYVEQTLEQGTALHSTSHGLPQALRVCAQDDPPGMHGPAGTGE